MRPEINAIPSVYTGPDMWPAISLTDRTRWSSCGLCGVSTVRASHSSLCALCRGCAIARAAWRCVAARPLWSRFVVSALRPYRTQGLGVHETPPSLIRVCRFVFLLFFLFASLIPVRVSMTVFSLAVVHLSDHFIPDLDRSTDTPGMADTNNGAGADNNMSNQPNTNASQHPLLIMMDPVHLQLLL